MTRSRFPLALRRFVVAQKDRGATSQKIAREVRKRWPEFWDFTDWSVNRILSMRRPKDTRAKKVRSAVQVSLGGPKWSKPKRRAA